MQYSILKWIFSSTDLCLVIFPVYSWVFLACQIKDGEKQIWAMLLHVFKIWLKNYGNFLQYNPNIRPGVCTIQL